MQQTGRNKRKSRKSRYGEDDPFDIFVLLSNPFIEEETRLEWCQQLDEILHGSQPEHVESAEPMPKEFTKDDVFRAHALGIELGMGQPEP